MRQHLPPGKNTMDLTCILWVFAILFAFLPNPAHAKDVDKKFNNQETPAFWDLQWPRTDFHEAKIHFSEVISGGPQRDGIPPIEDPVYTSIENQRTVLSPTEPVISINIGGDARAYPLRVMTWHEIVNDTVNGMPLSVTYCPLCNAAIVYDARIDGVPTTFGTTGKLRNSDLIMYDRTTESWWQQFQGEAIVGELTGKILKQIPSRLESFEKFATRFPDGKVLVPNNERMRAYGANPYVGYDTSSRPFLYNGEMPDGIEPLARVIAVGKKAWSMQKLRDGKFLTDGDLALSWTAGQNSALDTRQINQGRDVGNVVVQRNGQDVPYDVTFAFVFHAFRPEGELIF